MVCASGMLKLASDLTSKCIRLVNQRRISENDSDLCFLQNVLEKFEFFPIKCRVQRSLENFKRTWNGSQASKGLKWNQKVQLLLYWKSNHYLMVDNHFRKINIVPEY